MRRGETVVAMWCALLWACGGSADTPVQETSDTGSATSSTVPVEAFVTVAENPNNTLSALVTVETTEEATVAIAFESAETTEQLTGSSPMGTTHEIVVVGMRHKTVYDLTPVVTYASGGSGRADPVAFETGRKPSGLPDMTVTVSDAKAVQPGITIVGPPGEQPSETPEFVGLDSDGKVVWYYDDPDEAWESPDRDVKLMADGNLLIKTPDGLRVIDLAGNTVFDLWSGDVGLGMHHDVTMLPNGNFMSLVQQERQVNVEALGGTIRQIGDGLLEITPQGEVVWEWWTFDHIDTDRFPTQMSLEDNRGRYDWTHANSVAYRASDASILVSFRHQDWVIKIDHATGEIVWRAGDDGDFDLLSGEWFSGQHSAYLTDDGQLSVYDNGNERSSGEQYSRGVIYQLDETAMTAQPIFDYPVGAFTPFIGGHRVLPNGNSLLCAGGVVEGASKVYEVSPLTNEAVWTLEIEDSVLYRAQRLPSFWHGEPVP